VSILRTGRPWIGHFGVKTFGLSLVRQRRPEVRAMRDALTGSLLLPDADVRQLLAIYLRERPASLTHLIIEGYPRSTAQLGDLHAVLADNGAQLAGLAVVDIDDSTVYARTSARTSCQNCGHPAAVDRSDSCQYCGGPMAARPDDAAGVLSRRLRDYREVVRTLRAEFAATSVVFEVNGRWTPDEIGRELLTLLSTRTAVGTGRMI
jgi:adenylate kinase